jgi:hypothetical protein
VETKPAGWLPLASTRLPVVEADEQPAAAANAARRISTPIGLRESR